MDDFPDDYEYSARFIQDLDTSLCRMVGGISRLPARHGLQLASRHLVMDLAAAPCVWADPLAANCRHLWTSMDDRGLSVKLVHHEEAPS
jgi:hypothetical protein